MSIAERTGGEDRAPHTASVLGDPYGNQFWCSGASRMW